MTYISISWFGHGFGFGVWRTKYEYNVIWSVCFLCVSVYISKPASPAKGAGR